MGAFARRISMEFNPSGSLSSVENFPRVNLAAKTKSSVVGSVRLDLTAFTVLKYLYNSIKKNFTFVKLKFEYEHHM